MVSWTGEHIQVSTQRNEGRQRTAPTRLRERASLHKGLDGALSIVSARLVGQAARGFVVELLARAS
jgi:hypothetical protein